MNIFVRKSCLSFIILSALIEIIQANKNESNGDVRQGRVTGRIVKLYSGFKPNPIVCLNEGFRPDPTDCSVFYRCVKASHRGNFNIFRYQCGPGTVYDPDTEICNHPRSTKRSECGGIMSTHDNTDENEDNEVGHELPSPISTILPFHISQSDPINNTVLMLTTVKPLQSDIHTMTTMKYEPPAPAPAYPWMGSRNDTYQITLTTVAPLLDKSNPCVSDGFIGDHENCRKFYRCVRNSYGSFTRHEFFCSDSTIWDDNIQSCNHAWAARNSRCGRNNDSFKDNQSSYDVTSQNEYQQFNYGLKTTKKYNNGEKYENKPNQVENSGTVDFNRDLYNVNEINDYNSPSIHQPPNVNSHISKETSKINDQYGNIQKQTTIAYSTEILPQKGTQMQGGKSAECSQSGFVGDPNDCSKFYRCVDSGNGKFMKYDFSCSPGTVWDSTVEACNHAWAVKECGGLSPIKGVSPSSSLTTSSDSSVSVSTSSSSTTYKITTESTTNDDLINENNDSSYFNPNKAQEETTKPTTVSLISSTTSATQSANECKDTSFFGDLNNCQIFYRCVDNGNGGYTKFEYKCGEGTLWDQDIEACNHAWAVKSCGSQSITNITETTKVSDKFTTNSYVQATTMSVIPSNNYNTEYSAQETQTEKPDKNEINEVSKEPETNKNMCENVGFIGDPNDCRKFYRCVDNGNGGYIQHQFLCGEGTVWDSSIEACNHAWAVKSCGGSTETKEEMQNISQSTDSQSTTYSSELSSDNASSGHTTQNYNTQNTTARPISTTFSTTTISNNNECSGDGFVGDKYDCKKFYRCVKNDIGGYERYDFNCGDGTLWDPKIQACNHEWAVKECSGSISAASESNINEMNTPTPSSMEENENSYTTQSSPEQGNSSSSTTIQSPISTTSMALNSTGKCHTSGFIGDENNCKKFYRCVENDDGMFTAYEFTCGEGTVWDSEITACNHEWAVAKCNGNQNEQIKTTSEYDQSGNAQSTSSTASTIGSSMSTSSTQMSHSSVTTSTLSTTIMDSSLEEEQKCDSEGFFPNKNDCRKFFRCVDNGKGSYNKYEFDCGEGTIWVQEIQACDHDTLGENCTSSIMTSSESHKVTSSTNMPIVSNTSSESGIISTTDESEPNTDQTMQMNCQNEGFFGNTDDCKKFYRCVSDGKGGFSKYDYTCGEGTIWDNEIIACNHPQDVSNPSCRSEHENSSEINNNNKNTTTEKSTESMTSISKTTTESISTMKETEKPLMSTTISSGTTSGSSTTSDSTTSNTNCANNNTAENSDSQDFKCEKAGFYADKYDCKKFHRCVDWDGNGNKFSVYHFECGDGTIWDPALETCNHESSVVPPRNCNSAQQGNVTETTTTTEKPTTIHSEMTQITTTQSSTTEMTTQSTSTEISSSEQSTTQSSSSEQTTTQSSSSEQSTTQSSSTEQTTTQSSSTEQSTTQSSSSEQSTTQSSSTEQSTTQLSTTEPLTTQASVTSDTQATTTEQTTTQSNQEQTTKSTTEQTNSTEETLSTESTTETTQLTSISTDQTATEQTNTSTEPSTTEDNISQITEVQSTTSESTTTESTTESSSQQECPETDSDQSLFVCPTSFKRHPKYCNLFYQCVEDNDSHEVKVTVFNCPNNTIYDESKIQCVEEEKSDKKCNGKIAQKHRVKRLGSMFNEPISVTTKTMACPSAGHFPFEIQEECSEAFLKCELMKSGKLRGFVYKCPKGYVYWTVSRRCESIRKVRDCKRSSYPWNSRYDVPLEKYNIAS